MLLSRNLYPEPTANADVDGFAVVIANILVSFSSRILVTWSPANIDVGIKASLIQSYPVLLSTLLSINRNQLSVYEAGSAISLTSPPLTVYLAISSICDIFGIKTDLYKRVRSHRHVIRLLGALMLPLWLALTLTYWFSSRAFVGSEAHVAADLWKWLVGFLFGHLFFPVSNTVANWIYSPIMVLLFFLCLFRRRTQVMTDFRAHREGVSGPWVRWKISWTFVKCAWCTVDRNHKWWAYSILAYLDCCWTLGVIHYATDAPDRYVLSYGQLLSLFAAIPPLIPTVNLVYASRWDMLHLLRRLPRSFLTEVTFLLTGVEPYGPIQDTHLPFNVTPDLEKLTSGKLRDRMIMSVRSTHQPLLFLESDSMGSGWGRTY